MYTATFSCTYRIKTEGCSILFTTSPSPIALTWLSEGSRSDSVRSVRPEAEEFNISKDDVDVDPTVADDVEVL